MDQPEESFVARGLRNATRSSNDDDDNPTPEKDKCAARQPVQSSSYVSDHSRQTVRFGRSLAVEALPEGGEALIYDLVLLSLQLREMNL